MPTGLYPQQWFLKIEILYGRNKTGQPWLKHKTDIHENNWLVAQTQFSQQTIKQKYGKVNNFLILHVIGVTLTGVMDSF